ncbi:hypothetical protein [uncultured Flavobacterium sp.]|uniref:hypothetical protein n=1 Tax=uncultured Flavobacterium sp. TaxID=165435 RepID=UPI0030CA51D4|tara:strand:- start:932 stop:1543 length:612 start_codon:yes stop_codon:yes gene_type:complete
MDIKKLLPLFSYVFHPIFISIYGLLIYLITSKTAIFSSFTLLLVIQVLILTLLLPLSIYFLLKATGYINSFTEATIQERKTPILLQIIFLILLIKFSSLINDIYILYYFFVGGLIAAVSAFMLTFVSIKISLHMMGVCSLLAFTICLGLYLNTSLISLIACEIFVVGSVASSRLYMKSHSVSELISGSIIGLISQIILWQYYL